MQPKPLKVYLDTSIFNFAISTQDVATEKEVTNRFLNELKSGRFFGYVSAIVLREIHDTTNKQRREDLLKFLGQFELEALSQTEEADLLAERYIQEKIIPEKHLDDALHIAIASVHNLDVIVSWNFAHMVKFKTRREVQGINTMMGYKIIEICTPQEVL